MRPTYSFPEAVVEEKFDLARENAYRLRDVFGKGGAPSPPAVPARAEAGPDESDA